MIACSFLNSSMICSLRSSWVMADEILSSAIIKKSSWMLQMQLSRSQVSAKVIGTSIRSKLPRLSGPNKQDVLIYSQVHSKLTSYSQAFLSLEDALITSSVWLSFVFKLQSHRASMTKSGMIVIWTRRNTLNRNRCFFLHIAILTSINLFYYLLF